jgi:hypothetical protein
MKGFQVVRSLTGKTIPGQRERELLYFGDSRYTSVRESKLDSLTLQRQILSELQEAKGNAGVTCSHGW